MLNFWGCNEPNLDIFIASDSISFNEYGHQNIQYIILEKGKAVVHGTVGETAVTTSTGHCGKSFKCATVHGRNSDIHDIHSG